MVSVNATMWIETEIVWQKKDGGYICYNSASGIVS